MSLKCCANVLAESGPLSAFIPVRLAESTDSDNHTHSQLIHTLRKELMLRKVELLCMVVSNSIHLAAPSFLLDRMNGGFVNGTWGPLKDTDNRCPQEQPCHLVWICGHGGGEASGRESL